MLAAGLAIVEVRCPCIARSSTTSAPGGARLWSPCHSTSGVIATTCAIVAVVCMSNALRVSSRVCGGSRPSPSTRRGIEPARKNAQHKPFESLMSNALERSGWEVRDFLPLTPALKRAEVWHWYGPAPLFSNCVIPVYSYEPPLYTDELVAAKRYFSDNDLKRPDLEEFDRNMIGTLLRAWFTGIVNH